MKRRQRESWPIRLVIIVWMFLTVTYRQEFNVFAPATHWLGNFGLWPFTEMIAAIAIILASLLENS